MAGPARSPFQLLSAAAPARVPTPALPQPHRPSQRVLHPVHDTCGHSSGKLHAACGAQILASLLWRPLSQPAFVYDLLYKHDCHRDSVTVCALLRWPLCRWLCYIHLRNSGSNFCFNAHVLGHISLISIAGALKGCWPVPALAN